MAYRDETERLRARVEELEDELDHANQRLRELAQPAARQESAGIGPALAGGPTRIVREHVLEGELPKAYQEEIIEALHRRFGVFGQASSVGRTLAWTGASTQNQRQLEVSVTVRNGKTVVRIVERLGNLAGGLFGGVVGGVGGGGLGLILPGVMLTRAPQLIPFTVIAWVALVYGIVRAIYSRIAARREAEIDGAAAELADIVSDALSRERKKPRVRVPRDSDEAEASDAAELADIEAEREREEEEESAKEQASKARRARRRAR